ncbi:unnamed protein product [Acanthoscelides obtectus]|uniref:Uncharacterized protein n=1 Tax=Acanthoscelides obtectus TaxID=200917 RepID=A0A9P0PEJ7_ACAOB|nr:unnamed protein product [Acanthoscelides obtectus]CAK1664492.1 hypothetical protein AOBTE_LOCUS24290 [Acanthoscelides obtectus]
MARFILLTLGVVLLVSSTYSSERSSSRQKRRAFIPFFLTRTTPHPDPEYRLNIETGHYKRQEMSDGHGNIKGKYTYWNEGGEHTIDYFAGQDPRYLSAAMTLPIPGAPIVPKYFFLPRHVYPCATNHTKEKDNIGYTVEPLDTTEVPTGSTEDSTDQTTEGSQTTVGSEEKETTTMGA